MFICSSTSNACRISGLRGVRQMFGGPIFFGVERNLTSLQSTKIWCDFSKILVKINKNWKKNIEKIRKNANYWKRF